MQHFGQILVFASFLLTAGTVALALGGAARRRPDLVRAAGQATRAVAWLNAAISLVLVHAILSHDFSNRYVASYTDSGMPLMYLLTAFWGGEKGALLFWVLTLSLLAGALARVRRDGSPYTGWVLGVTAATLLFFDVLMVFASSPFEGFLTTDGPPDGSGLNPLLMNPLMAVHPPFQLAGFIAYTIPFAFASASLLSGRNDAAWVRDSRPWYLLAWSLLTAGLAIGGLWAYLELGWGGFWGWDPVENAALLPWLSGTAALHTSSLDMRRATYRRWNLVLVFVTFLLTIFATFLTRSQLIQSLHSFSNSVLTPFFLYFMVVLVAFFGLLLAYRWRGLGASAARLSHVWSREGLVLVNTLVFVICLFIVLWGTLLPKISESSAVQAALGLEQAVDVGPEWFNMVVAPVGVIMVLLTAAGPLVPYRTGTPGATRTLARTAVAGLAAALVVAILFAISRGSLLAGLTGEGLPAAAWRAVKGLALPGFWGLLSIAGAGWIVAAVVTDWRRAAATRAAVTGERAVRAAASLLRANPRRFGGHLAHLGVALAFLGFAGGAAKIVRKDVVLDPMDRLSIGGTDLIFLGTDERYDAGGQYASLRSHVLAWPAGKALADGTVESLVAASGAASGKAGTAPEVELAFASAAAAAEFHATAFMQTAGQRDFVKVLVVPERREVQLAPFAIETLRFVPRSFHRQIEEMKGLAAATGGRLTVTASRGDPVITVRAADDAMFKALTRPSAGAAAWAGVRRVKDRPTEVAVVPAGMGMTLRPEMRFYAKSENPTTEVRIDSGLFTDLYVAATPGEGSQSMSLTAMVNPLMSGVWLGSLVLILVTLGLAVPVGTLRTAPAPARAPEGEPEEGVAP
ncbi:MAG: cytochrome c biogenesis protein CcsA [Deltaproteobacteria bacterium]|nr:cytochrome c biogenesis protein CcsA [Deltaproteobacteria bacterium]